MVGKNFDELAPRFRRNVYSSHKGRIRLAVLWRDFAEWAPGVAPEGKTPVNSETPQFQTETLKHPLEILDAGGGQAQFSIELARIGHQITLCDLSKEMIEIAKQSTLKQGVNEKFQFVQSSVQEFCDCDKIYDVVLCHALLEWVDEPEKVLNNLVNSVKPGGYLSLIYYNLNGLIYKNLLRANFKKIRQQKWQGFRGSLTPTTPLTPNLVNSWIDKLSLKPLCESGIRVFSDYIFDRQLREKNEQDIVDMELQFSRRQPYQYLGRYMHLLIKV